VVQVSARHRPFKIPRQISSFNGFKHHNIKTRFSLKISKDGLQRGITKEEMMEALHVGAAIKGGATLVHGVQMMNKVNKLDG